MSMSFEVTWNKLTLTVQDGGNLNPSGHFADFEFVWQNLLAKLHTKMTKNDLHYEAPGSC